MPATLVETGSRQHACKGAPEPTSSRPSPPCRWETWLGIVEKTGGTELFLAAAGSSVGVHEGGGERVMDMAILIETARPVATLEQLGPALTRCFQAPEGSTGSQITVRLSLNSSGGIIGRPMITYAKLMGSPDDKRAFAEAALRAVAACTPVAVTAGFGASIAGRMLSIRFIGGAAQAI